MKKKLLGHVGVDSGQLIICDPCYIDSEWMQEDFKDIRIHKHKKTGRLFAYNSSTETNYHIKSLNKINEFFDHYEKKTSTGKTMNEMLINKEMSECLPVPEKLKTIGHFSYAGSCETTGANKHQLNFKKGHPGVAVAFNSGYGDGLYPIYGTFNTEGRCLKVEIDCRITKTQHQFFTHENKPTPKTRSKKNSK